jgi:hypothetical protein
MELGISNSLDIPKPSAWPVSMSRFGVVPLGTFRGDPIYRVVFAPTCKKLIFGTASDGTTGAHVRAKHPAAGKKWILEKWISGWEACKMTPTEYERWGPRDPQSGMLIEGPYPSSGIYEHCWTFDSIEEISGVDKIIGMINHGAKRSAAQVKQGNAELDAKAEKEASDKRFLRCRETEPLYGIRPASFAGKPKTVNHKSQKTPIAANNLGLPTRRGSVVAMKGPQVKFNGSI